MVSEERMKEIAQKVAGKHGFKSASAEFVPFRDFKLKWSRTVNWIEFHVSDYLKDADDEVIEDMLDIVLDRILGTESNYTLAILDYLMSAEFTERQRPKYLKRCELRDKTELNDDSDNIEMLENAYIELVNEGLIPEQMERPVFRWADQNKMSTASTLMNVVFVARDLFGAEETAIKFAVYEGIRLINDGLLRFGVDIPEMDMGYPDRERAKDICRSRYIQC